MTSNRQKATKNQQGEMADPKFGSRLRATDQPVNIVSDGADRMDRANQMARAVTARHRLGHQRRHRASGLLVASGALALMCVFVFWPEGRDQNQPTNVVHQSVENDRDEENDRVGLPAGRSEEAGSFDNMDRVADRKSDFLANDFEEDLAELELHQTKKELVAAQARLERLRSIERHLEHQLKRESLSRDGFSSFYNNTSTNEF